MKLADFMQDQYGQGAAAQKLANQSPEDGQEDNLSPQGESDKQGPANSDQGEAVTPEEQEIYDRVVTAGLTVMNEAAEQILSTLNPEAPAQSLADTTWLIMSSVDEQTGGEIEEEILLVAGAEVLENLGELANEAGVFPVDNRLVNEAYQLILARFSEEFGIDFGAEFEGEINATDEQSLLKQMGV